MFKARLNIRKYDVFCQDLKLKEAFEPASMKSRFKRRRAPHARASPRGEKK
jgi:hypothetical protein